MKKKTTIIVFSMLLSAIYARLVLADCPQAQIKPLCYGTPQEQAPCLREYQKRVDAALKQCEAEQARLGQQQTYRPPLPPQGSSPSPTAKDSYWYHSVDHAEPFFYDPSVAGAAAGAKSQCEQAHHNTCVSAHGTAPAL
jgi:hypothetical protein